MASFEGEKGRRSSGLLFLIGVLVGVAGALVLPRVIGWFLPGGLGPGRIVEGEVVEKVIEEDRLLLKVQAAEESFLATFVRRQKDVSLLVDRGDLVALEVGDTDPFPVDPDIERVRKPAAQPASPGSAFDASPPHSGRDRSGVPSRADTTAPTSVP